MHGKQSPNIYAIKRWWYPKERIKMTWRCYVATRQTSEQRWQSIINKVVT